MFDARVLETAAGLIFIYLLLSILCSAAFELMASWEWTNRFIGSRGKILKEGMSQILGPDLQTKLYDHLLIRSNARMAYTGPLAWIIGLFVGTRKDGSQAEEADRKRMVSYISPGNFSLALAEILLEEISPNCKESEITAVQLKLKPESRRALAAIVNLRAASGLMTVTPNHPLIDEADEKIRIAALEAHFLAIQSRTKEIANLISGLLRKNMHPDDRPLDAVEKWFEECMDRVSGRYKRESNNWILALGFIAAVFMNADSIRMARKLWLEEDLRKAVFTQSEAFLKDGSNKPPELYDPTKPDTGAPARLTMVQAQLANYSLPLGWNSASPDNPKGFWAYVWRFFGWCLTALAISFGAPFWFDLLNKVVRLRVTGNKPEKKKEEV